ncbi:hypothetical protein N7489_011434 [Penicillium chrysogenum]|uniref:Uncharacterized protein n=1 Tax=Penicillium chrysogenum TaxID=5076 RepID=A0ABQ8W1K3_PENCH|nr:uncharacterized protein N7489_011434 [Penicillium chrysogenum]KAJ5230726.1 hypothetical protein N7489_011434 [Penicillium chrysogenum]KAJ5254601.1 hypothetical protein N7505_011810 [Penicillium chrysogenum]KAJ5268201.1 hypothetical protein N7524_005660 [Penicillium chrysogenum]KAJ6163040.1 hypothetical protein N7497_003019 [Penicillium chrysogenum]
MDVSLRIYRTTQKPYWIDRSHPSVSRRAGIIMAMARLGREKLTLETVKTSMLLWLQRKGLTTQTLEQIDENAGSLTRGSR